MNEATTLARLILANAATLRAMSRIKPLLSTWPAILPEPGRPELRPLAIGIHKPIMALLIESTVQNRKYVKQAISVLTRSPEYVGVRNAPGAMRHDIDGNPVEPVAEEHKVDPKNESKAEKKVITPQRKETIIVPVSVKALKVTAVVPAAQLKPIPAGADVTMAVEVIGGMKATARLNPRSYRKAVAVVAEHGADNVAVVVQGSMVRAGVIEGAGIVAQVKTRKE